MSIRVQYETGSNVKNAGRPSKTCERWFSSLDAALREPTPDGFTLASIELEDGSSYFRKAPFDWERHEAPK